MATDRFGIDESYHDARGTRARDLARNAGRAAGRHGRRAPETAGAAAGRARTPCASCCRAAIGRCTDRWRAAPTWCWRTARRVRSTATARCRTSCRSATTACFARGGDETLLIVSPGRCFLPDDLRTWGFAAQLYAARSRDSWGIGDLADLARLGRWTREPGRRRADGQSADGADAGAADRSRARTTRRAGATATRCSCASRSVPGLGRAAGRPARAPDERRNGAEPRPAHRSRRDLPPQAGGAGGAVRPLPRRAGLRLVLRRRGPGADRLRDLRALAERHGKDWRQLARRATAAPTAPTSRAFRDAQTRAHPLPRLDAVADRRPARARVEGDRASSTTCRSASTSRAPTPGAGRT